MKKRNFTPLHHPAQTTMTDFFILMILGILTLALLVIVFAALYYRTNHMAWIFYYFA